MSEDENEEISFEDIEGITCEICSKFSYTRKEHNKHLKAHSKDNDCHICKKPFSTKKCRARHYGEAHKDVMLNCDPCNIKYKRVYDMCLHQKFHTRECPYLCMICLKSFYTLTGLKEHHQRQHEKKIENIITLNKIFQENPEDLDRIIIDKTYKEVGSGSFTLTEGYMCESCGKTFNLQRRLIAHMLSDHPTAAFQCDSCKKGFKNRKRLIEHMTRFGKFNGECKPAKRVRPVCNICDKSFCDMRQLKRHREFHLPTGHFPCLLCDKVFDLNIKLKLHVKWHRKEAKRLQDADADRFKTYACDFCGKIMPNAKSLDSHRRLHLGTFTCTLCGRIFNKKWNLKTHMTVHLGDKPYSCSYCGASYSDRSNLKKHLTKHPSELGAHVLVNKKPEFNIVKD